MVELKTKSEKMYLDINFVKNKEFLETIIDEVTCIICTGILIFPFKCNSCENHFCNFCIKDWQKKSPTCPFKCQSSVVTEASRITKKMLNNLVLICPENCGEEFSYEKLFEHREKCNVEIAPCPCCKTNVNKKLANVKEYFISKKAYENHNSIVEILKTEIESYKSKVNELSILLEKSNLDINNKNQLKDEKNSINQFQNNFNSKIYESNVVSDINNNKKKLEENLQKPKDEKLNESVKSNILSVEEKNLNELKENELEDSNNFRGSYRGRGARRGNEIGESYIRGGRGGKYHKYNEEESGLEFVKVRGRGKGFDRGGHRGRGRGNHEHRENRNKEKSSESSEDVFSKAGIEFDKSEEHSRGGYRGSHHKYRGNDRGGHRGRGRGNYEHRESKNKEKSSDSSEDVFNKAGIEFDKSEEHNKDRGGYKGNRNKFVKKEEQGSDKKNEDVDWRDEMQSYISNQKHKHEVEKRGAFNKKTGVENKLFLEQYSCCEKLFAARSLHIQKQERHDCGYLLHKVCLKCNFKNSNISLNCLKCSVQF